MGKHGRHADRALILGIHIQAQVVKRETRIETLSSGLVFRFTFHDSRTIMLIEFFLT
jgi:hypothetical protein